MLLPLVTMVLAWPVARPCRPTDGGMPVVYLGVGTQKVVHVDSPTTVRTTRSGVVDVRVVSPTLLLIIGAGKGRTQVRVEEDGGVRGWSVEVATGDDCDLCINELAKIFPCGSTLEMRMVGERIFLEGEASSVEEWRRTFVVVQQFANVVVLGHPKPEVVELAFREADAALSGAGFSQTRWVRAGEAVLLEGSVAEEDLPKLRALEADWRPKLEALVTRPRRRPTPGDE